MTTKKQAAAELFGIASHYELKLALSTVYRNCFFDKPTQRWRYIEKAHDYSYFPN